jgi:hypothetical protein
MPPDLPGATPARLFHGLVSGLAATGAMSIVFGVGQLVGAIDREPPRLIVDTLLRALPERAHGPLAGMLHLGYGAAGGAAYATIARPEVRGVLSGSLFGLAVWISSYEGWVPAVGVMPPAHRDRRGRAVAMLLAHIVYGATLGTVARRIGAAGEA